MRIIQSLYEKIDLKGKIQAVGKKEKQRREPIFLLCAQCETIVHANILNILFVLWKWVLFLTTGYDNWRNP